MSISSIGGGAPVFTDLGIGLSPEGRLALLVLEHEETQQDGDRDAKALAREQYVAASNEQVAALRDEADDLLTSAFVQGALTLTSAAIQVDDALDDLECGAKEKPWGEIAAGGCTGMAPAVGKFFDAAVADDRADGMQASQAAKLAEWDMADSGDAIKKSDERQDKTTNWLDTSNASQASTTAAIIAGFA